MAKRKVSFDLPDEVIDEDLSARSTKIPLDATGSENALSGYQEIPTTLLHPFSQKMGFDFSRHGEILSEQFVESVKQVGILEAIIVRHSPSRMGMYEILAGESRWEHAKEAGLEKVPCRVMDLDDDAAKSTFYITNVLRRDLTIRDRIYGWYFLYQDAKEKTSNSRELTEKLLKDQYGVMTVAGGKGQSIRSIYRYVKMHDLVSEWIDRLDAGTVTLRAGERVSYFPEDIQRLLLPYKIPEGKINWLLEIFQGKNKSIPWSPDLIAGSFEPLAPPEEKAEAVKPEEEPVKLTKEERAARRQERAYAKAFKQSAPKLLDAAREKLRKEDYERADEVISKALELYYKQETQG